MIDFRHKQGTVCGVLLHFPFQHSVKVIDPGSNRSFFRPFLIWTGGLVEVMNKTAKNVLQKHVKYAHIIWSYFAKICKNIVSKCPNMPKYSHPIL